MINSQETREFPNGVLCKQLYHTNKFNNGLGIDDSKEYIYSSYKKFVQPKMIGSTNMKWACCCYLFINLLFLIKAGPHFLKEFVLLTSIKAL